MEWVLSRRDILKRGPLTHRSRSNNLRLQRLSRGADPTPKYKLIRNKESEPVEDVLVEGFIDLLFEDDAGLVIVDYKTDALTSHEEIQQSMASYRLQGGAYALALKKSSGRPVTEAVFLFLQPQMEVAVEDLEGAMADAGRAAVV